MENGEWALVPSVVVKRCLDQVSGGDRTQSDIKKYVNRAQDFIAICRPFKDDIQTIKRPPLADEAIKEYAVVWHTRGMCRTRPLVSSEETRRHWYAIPSEG